MKNVVRVATGTRKNKRHKKNGYAPVPATTEFVHLNIRGGLVKEIEARAEKIRKWHMDWFGTDEDVHFGDCTGEPNSCIKCSSENLKDLVLEALHQTRLEALGEGRREGDKFFFIREKSLKNRLQLMGEKVKELQNAKNNICK